MIAVEPAAPAPPHQSEKESLIASLAAKLVDEPDFVSQILLPLLQVSGADVVEVTFATRTSTAYKELVQGIADRVWSMPEGEFLIATNGQRLARLILRDVVEVMKADSRKLIKLNPYGAWFHFDNGPYDIRKITTVSRNAGGKEQLRGVSANVVFVVTDLGPNAVK